MSRNNTDWRGGVGGRRQGKLPHNMKRLASAELRGHSFLTWLEADSYRVVTTINEHAGLPYPG